MSDTESLPVIDPAESLPRIAIPAYGYHTTGEKLVVFAPVIWHERIQNLSPYCCYGGTKYSKAILDLVASVSLAYKAGKRLEALAHLTNARALAARLDERRGT